MERIRFEEYQEGWSVQACHIGPFDTETETFAKMQDYCEAHDLSIVPTMGNYQHQGDLSCQIRERQHQKKAKNSLTLAGSQNKQRIRPIHFNRWCT